ncbi:MAG: DUF480 domain-containing protein [Gemmatimonadaceae bacterium]
MHPPRTHVSIRVLGSLMEKLASRSDTDPLTRSAPVAAYDQRTNCDPVMPLDEDTVRSAITTLRRRNLLRAIQPVRSRVTKHQHARGEALDLEARELVIRSVRMLRGPLRRMRCTRAWHDWPASRMATSRSR